MKTVICVLLFLVPGMVSGQARQTRNIILITLDGYRWQEIFEGPDPRIFFNPKYVSDTLIWQRFGDPVDTIGRKKLMPFFWNAIATGGQLYGNRKMHSKVNCINPHHLSYPGYNELLAGFNDPLITSNRPEVNPNETVLEFINRQPEFRGKVAVFAGWDAFPYILNQERSELIINGSDNEAAADSRVVEPLKGDGETFRAAFEYLKRERPSVLFISLNEMDSHGHRGRYDEYLKAAHHADGQIAALWDWIQNDSTYRDRTTILITTDHGRGRGKHSWQNHRRFASGSGQIWFAVIGPDTPPFGEMKIPAQYYQDQVAKTLAAFLGLDFNPVSMAGEIVQTMLAVPDEDHENVLVDKSVEGQ